MQIFSRLFVVAVVVCFIGTIRPAHADIVVLQGNDSTGTNNVVINASTDVPVVTGSLLNGPTVEFTSSGNLNGDSVTQRVTPAAANTPFDDITISLDGGATYTRAVFDINAGLDGSVLIHVEGVNINGGFYEDSFAVDNNGQNVFTITSINGQLMSSISLSAISGAVFEDLRTIRLGGYPVPEPASGLLLVTTLIGFATSRRFTEGSSGRGKG